MTKVNILLWGIVLTLFCGCNSVSSKKEKQLPEINPKIKELLAKTEVLQVPCKINYERFFKQNPEILPLEMQKLLSVNKINNNEHDLSEVIELSRQINLSKNFKTLLFSISGEVVGENVLVNYSNNFEFIDCMYISYEDYVEGYRYHRSLIDKNRIILYKDNNENPETDTTYYRINAKGVIEAEPEEWKGKVDPKNFKETYGKVHASIKESMALMNILETEKFRIRIDRLSDYSFRYASWSIDKKTSDKPDLVVLNGEYIKEGSGGNHSYEFKNGKYLYKCSIQPLREHNASPAVLRVYKNGKEILCQSAKVMQ